MHIARATPQCDFLSLRASAALVGSEAEAMAIKRQQHKNSAFIAEKLEMKPRANPEAKKGNSCTDNQIFVSYFSLFVAEEILYFLKFLQKKKQFRFVRFFVFNVVLCEASFQKTAFLLPGIFTFTWSLNNRRHNKWLLCRKIQHRGVHVNSMAKEKAA